MEKNCKKVVIIPCYEPSMNFIDYLKVLKESEIQDVIVVNDGSGEKYEPIFEKAKEYATVISYEKNQGKGYALKQAFIEAKDSYDENTVFATADCDGQHLVEDVIKCLDATISNPDNLILGVRDFSQKNVPQRSRIGNVNTRRLFRLIYKIRISDTQTGLRAFSYKLLDSLIDVEGDRFEYEMNMLIVLPRAKVQITEVPITTVYEKKADDVEKRSHFDTFRDSRKVWGVIFKNMFKK